MGQGEAREGKHTAQARALMHGSGAGKPSSMAERPPEKFSAEWQMMPSTQPLPIGWRDPRDLLSELLSLSVQLEPISVHPTTPDEHKVCARKVQLATLPEENDPVKRGKRWRREIAEAAPILGNLVDRIRRLTSLPLLPPAQYRAEWQGVIDAWNKEITENDWRSLPPLCEVCGKPVFRRKSERIASENYELSTVCSDSCRLRRKRRRWRPAKTT